MSDESMKIIGENSNVRTIINGLSGTNRREIRQELKHKLGEMLKNGEISKREMKDIIKYVDRDLSIALVSKNRVELAKLDNSFIDKKAQKLASEVGLTMDDLFTAGRLADDDFTINTVKLSKEEKAEAETGERTRSELVNIQNELNAKIKAKGGERLLTERETLQLMEGIGYANGTRKVSNGKGVLAGLFPPFNITNAIVAWTSHGKKDLVSTTKEETAYGSQAESSDTVVNETEAKMKELFRTEVQEYSEVQENPEEAPMFPEEEE